MSSTDSARPPLQRLLAASLMMLQVLTPMLHAGGAWAQATLPIMVDQSVAGQRPIVNVGANGMPIVQIAPPNAAGNSHNRFTEYNTGSGGVILNNSGANSQTQLGGWVGGNPMLGNRSARTIINEVTGSMPSRMNGPTEVAGNRANVIIANPNGISCNGCGFINAPRVTLTTGTPQFGADGSVTGFNVQRGQISIDGLGLNARDVDQLDLIARSLRVNAEIWATRLQVSMGANQVDYASGQATAQAGSGDVPAVAIDVAQLGGMYANSIRLIGTENGVGVNSAGNIAALTGDFEVSSAGDVRITGGQVQAKTNLALRSAGNINNAGTVYAEGNATVNATGNLNNTNLIAAAGNVQASAASLGNAGIIGAGVNPQGQVALAGNATLDVTGTLQSNGQILAGNNAAFTANAVTLDGGKVNAGNQAVITAAGVLSNRGELVADSVTMHAGALLDNRSGSIQAQTLSIATPRIDNTLGAILQTGNSSHLTLDAQQGIVNTQGRIAANAVNLTLAGSEINNAGGKIEHAGSGNLSIGTSGAITNTQGSIIGNGSTSLQAQSIANADGAVQAQGALAVTGDNGIDNTRGKLLTSGAAALATQGAFNNTQGTLQANAPLTARVGTALVNTQGVVQASQLDLRAGSIGNSGGQILQSGAGDTAIAVTGAFNNAGGTLSSNAANLNLTTGSVDNATGLLSHAGIGALTVTSNGAVKNAGGRILANKALTLSAQSLANTVQANQTGLIQAGATATIATSGDVSNAGGSIVTGQALDLQTQGNLNNAGGKMEAGQALNVVAVDIDNSAGRLTSLDGSGLTVRAAQTLTNTQGIIGGNGVVTVNADTLTNNQGTVLGAGNLTITANAIGNTQGAIQSQQQLTLNGGSIGNTQNGLMQGARLNIAATGFNNTTGAVIQTGTGNTAIQVTGSLNNTDGKIAGNGVDATVTAQSLDNTRGSIQHAGTGTLTVNGGSALINAAGTIAGNNNVTVTAATLFNTTGTAGGNLVQGKIAAANALQVNATTALNNNGGILQSNGALAVTTPALTNAGGSILTNGLATLTVAQLDNRNGAVAANRLAVAATDIQNTGGQIVSLGNAASNVNATQSINNAGGTVAGNGNLTLSGNSVNNQGGTIQAASNAGLNVTAVNLLDNAAAGKIASTGALVVQAGSMNNRTGQITSGSTLDATVAAALDNTQGTIAATGNATVGTGTLLSNNLGVIGSVQGNLSTTSGGSTDNTSGRLEAAQDVSVTANGMVNIQGVIAGRNTGVNTQGQALNNTGGKIAARHTLTIQSGALANIGGLLQATGAMTVNTQGQTLTNTLSGISGGIIGQNTVTLNAGKLDNQAGFIGGVGAMSLTATQVNNMQGGSMVGQGTFALSASNVDNTGGGLQVQGDATFNLGSGTFDNNGSLLRAGGILAVNAGAINNANTQGVNQGIEGASLNLAAATINNAGGAIRADNQLTLAATGTLDNTQGLVSSTNGVTINATTITNTLGTLIAGSDLAITAANLSGDGKLLSRGNMTVNLTGGFNNVSQVQASNNLNFTSAGAVTNSGLIRAGNILNLNAANLNNLAAGEISAATTNITVPGTINNQGLIDGTTTRVIAGAVNNTGRIYGDHVALQAGTLNNTTTGVIASRVKMDLGVGNLTNSEHAIIYSAGALTIGGALTAQNLATGSAGTVTNASATIESAGSMVLATGNLINRNDHFSMTTQTLGTQQVAEYQPSGWTNRLPSAGVGFNNVDNGRLVLDDNLYPLARFGPSLYTQAIVAQCDGENNCTNVLTYAITDPVWALFGVTPPGPPPTPPDMYFYYCNTITPPQSCQDYDTAIAAWNAAALTNHGELNQAIYAFNVNLWGRMVEDWYVYNIARTTSQSVVQSSDPARILAGGNLTLSGAVTNDKSQMIAGGAINGTAASINNIDAQGTRTVTDSGTVQFTELVSCGTFGDSHCRNWGAAGAYNPAAQVTPIGVPIALMQQNTTVSAGTAVPNATLSTIAQTASGAAQPVANVGSAQVIGSIATVNAPATASGAAPGAANVQVNAVATPAVAASQQQIGIAGVPGRPGPNGTPMVVRTAVPALTVPNNALFKTHAEPGSAYLIETDPRFANFRTWISSDFMLQQLSRNPAATLKRLGDGFYEQKLVAEQILLATGARFIGNYTNNEDEYRALMQAGAAFGQQYQLNIGTALTADQMRLLTTDLVWLVQKEVTLADGSKQSVLVPQVYVYVREGDLQGDGTLIAGNEIRLNVTGDFTNSGTIASRSVTALTADNIRNIGGRILGDTVALQAQTDLANLSGTIAGNSITLQAGRDLTLRTQTIDSVGQSGTRTGIDRIATVYGSNITALAGRDLTIAGAQISASGDIVLAANRHATIDAVRTVDNLNLVASGHIRQQSVQHVGSQIGAGGNLVLAAGQQQNGNLLLRGSELSTGGDLTAIGSNVSVQSVIDSSTLDMRTNLKNGYLAIQEHNEILSGGRIGAGGNITLAATGERDASGKAIAGTGNLTLQATDVTSDTGALNLTANNDIALIDQQRKQSSHYASEYKSGTLISKQSSKQSDDVQTIDSIGSSLSGDTVTLQAGRDVTIRGSSIVGSGDVTLTAQAGNITIAAAQSSSTESHFREARQSGISGSNVGVGITIGSSEQKSKRDGTATAQSQNRSTVGSIGGNLIVTAGRDALIQGSDLIAAKAPGDTQGATGHIDIQAQNITIEAGQDTSHTQATQETKSSGVTVAVVGTIVDSARNIKDAQKNPRKFGKVRGTMEEIGHSGLTAPQVAINYDRSESRTQTATDELTNTGSSLTAAGDVRLRATGNGNRDAAGRATDGDISVTGSLIAAGALAQLDAQRHITLQASTDRYRESSQTTSSSLHLSTAAPSLGDTGRQVSGGPNNSGVGAFPYGKANSSDSAETAASVQSATLVSADNIILNSRSGDIRITGSGLAAAQDIDLIARLGKIDIASGQDSRTHTEDHASKAVGDLGKAGSTGTSNTVGVHSSHTTLDTAQTQQNTIRSSLSAGGNLTIDARDDITVQGTDLRAGRDLTLIGANLRLDPGQDTSRSKQTSEMSQAGITLSMSGYAVEAAQALEQAANATEQKDNKRLAALYGAKAALTLYNGIPGSAATSSDPAKTASPLNAAGAPSNSSGAAIKATVSIGSKSADSQSEVNNTQQQGSTLTAGQTVTLIATGTGQKDSQGNATDGDITARGTRISGSNILLAAARDIALHSAQDTTNNRSTDHSNSASIGIGFGLGGQQNGFTLELAAAKAEGKANGDSSTNQNTQIAASNTLTLDSGRDTTLRGAQLKGDTIAANVGRDLAIASVQDSDTFHSKQDSAGFSASICIPPFCYGTTVSASVAVSSGNTDSTYQSVVNQSGLYAGQGGFDVAVKGNTDLKGAVIASAADAIKNKLVTGTLTTSDIENKADYQSDSSSMSLSYSGGNSSPGGITAPGGTIPGTNQIAAGSATQTLTSNLAANAAANAVGGQEGTASGVTKSAISAGSIVITDEAGQLAKTGKLTAETLASLNRDTATANGSIEKIFDQAKLQREQEEKKVLSEIAQQAAPLVYKKVGDQLVGQSTEVKVAVHALVGGLMSKLAGGDFGSGAAGAAAATLAVELFGKDIQNMEGMSQGDKDALIMLMGLTVGKLTAAAAGGSSTASNAAAITAKLATENNYLKHGEAAQFKKRLDGCESRQGGCPEDERKKLLNEYRAISAANNKELDLCAMRADADCLARIKANIAAPSEMPRSLVGQEANAFRGEQNRAQDLVALAQINLKSIEKGRQTVCGGLSAADCDKKLLQAHGDAGMRAVGIVLGAIGGSVALSAEAAAVLTTGVNLLIRTGQLAAGELAALYRMGPVLYCGVNASTCIIAADVALQVQTGSVAPSAGLSLPTTGRKAVSSTARTATGEATIAGAVDGAGGVLNAPKTIPYQPSGSVILQGNAPVCGPACAAMTISDKTGASVSLADVIGSFPNGIRPTGVSTTELSNVISNAGITNVVNTTMLPGELNQVLSNGQAVIVNVKGHFIIVDSKTTVNGVSYYMTRDPYVGPRGVIASALDNAMSIGANAIVIGKK